MIQFQTYREIILEIMYFTLIQISDPVDKSEQHYGIDIWDHCDNHGAAHHV